MAGKREAPQPARNGYGHSGRPQDSRSRSRSRDAYFEEDRPRSRSSRYESSYDYERPRARQTRYQEEDYGRERRRSSGTSSGSRRPPSDPPRGGGRKPKKRRMPVWQKVIIIILALIILLMVTAVALVWTKLGGINRIQIGNEAQTSENFEQDNPDASDTISDDTITFSDTKVKADADVINILLVGGDSRGEERGRSDTMIVVSLNRNTKQISLVSLMRDSYVQIPGYNNNKLNAAFAFGGYELLDETISQNFGIEIDFNVGVNFDGFQQVVDQLGGIDITLTAAEAEYMALWGFPDMVEGVNHMTGEQALCYARTRYVGTGQEANDFGRTYRQRVVMTTVYQEMMKKSLPEIWTILDSIMSCVETDMTNAQIISIGTEFYNMGIDNLQNYRLPQDGEYTGETINGMSVLVLDWDAAQQHLEEWLYSDTPAAEHGIDAAN